MRIEKEFDKVREKFHMAIPHCCNCNKELKVGQQVILSDMHHVEHVECFTWDEQHVLDRGTFEEIVTQHKKYFKCFLPIIKKNK